MAIVIVKLLIALVTGIAAAYGGVSAPLSLIVTGILMVLIAAEAMSGRRGLFVGIAAFAIWLGMLSGHWWGFLALSCMTLPPVPGGIGAALVYAVSASTGFVSTSFFGFGGGTESAMSKRIAEVIVVSLAVGILCGLLYLGQYLIECLTERRRKEAERLRNSMLNEMHERQLNREMAKQSFTAERNARLLERENISRNIHNSVGHSITAAILTLDAADMLFEAKPDEARKRMNEANERIRGSLDSIRSAVRALDDEGGVVPISDLKRYLENTIEGVTMDTDITAGCSYELFSEDILIPKEHAEFLTGALQECLSNGIRHGSANRFSVSLLADAAHIRMTVTDNGHGDFDESNRDEKIETGFGLKKIAAYADRCGGHATFLNDEGFRTEIELPFEHAGEGETDD